MQIKNRERNISDRKYSCKKKVGGCLLQVNDEEKKGMKKGKLAGDKMYLILRKGERMIEKIRNIPNNMRCLDQREEKR